MHPTSALDESLRHLIERARELPNLIETLNIRSNREISLDRDPLDFSQGWCPRGVGRYQFYQHTLAAHSVQHRP